MIFDDSFGISDPSGTILLTSSKLSIRTTRETQIMNHNSQFRTTLYREIQTLNHNDFQCSE